MSMSSKLLEKIRNKKKEIQARSGNREEVMRIPMGKHRFRILPAHPSKGGDAEFWADFGQHYVKSEERNERGNRKVKAVYVCVDKTFGKPCPLCESIENLIPQATDDEQLELLEESKCRRSEVLLNVLHRTGDKPGVPQILQMTPSTFENALSLMEEYGDITDINEGIDLVIERSGAGLNTKYSIMPAAKSEKVPASVLDQMTDLQEFVQQEHEDGLKRALTSLNNVVGLLDAPMKPAIAAPKATAAAADDDMMEVMDAEYSEVKEEPVVAKAAVGSDVTPAPTAPVAETATDEMDDLLAELEGL